MINRTFKFYGKAFSESETVFITVNFANEQIYSGPVLTTNDWAKFSERSLPDVLFEFVGSIDLTGQIPLSLSVSGGQVRFGAVRANYAGIQMEIDDSVPEEPQPIVIVPPEDFYAPVCKIDNESDGKINVKIDGVDEVRDIAQYPYATGDWQYLILDTQTLSCDIVVDPRLIRTQVPTSQQILARRRAEAASE